MSNIIKSIIKSANESVDVDSSLNMIYQYLTKNGYEKLDNPKPSDLRKGDRIIREASILWDTNNKYGSHEIDVVRSDPNPSKGYSFIYQAYRYVSTEDGVKFKSFNSPSTTTYDSRRDIIAVYRKAKR